MSATTSHLTASQRRDYLSAMGVDYWRPRVQLPGAKSAQVFARAIAKGDKKIPVAGASSDSVRNTTAKAPRRTAADILTDAPVQPRPSASEKPRPMSVSQSIRPVAVEQAALNLLLLECPRYCLLIDDAHHSRDQQALLQNLMFALTAQLPGSYRATPFDWASIPPQSGRAVDVLRGIIDRAVNQHLIHSIILMGDSARAIFECEGSATGPVAPPAWLAGEVQVIATHSSRELLAEPARKAATWGHVRSAISKAHS